MASVVGDPSVDERQYSGKQIQETEGEQAEVTLYKHLCLSLSL